jgi:hypothetical protein
LNSEKAGAAKIGGVALYLIAGVTGLAAGVVVWFTASYAVAHSIAWAESRYPGLAGSKAVRAGEALACGALFIASLTLAFWVMRLVMQR